MVCAGLRAACPDLAAAMAGRRTDRPVARLPDRMHTLRPRACAARAGEAGDLRARALARLQAPLAGAACYAPPVCAAHARAVRKRLPHAASARVCEVCACARVCGSDRADEDVVYYDFSTAAYIRSVAPTGLVRSHNEVNPALEATGAATMEYRARAASGCMLSKPHGSTSARCGPPRAAQMWPNSVQDRPSTPSQRTSIQTWSRRSWGRLSPISARHRSKSVQQSSLGLAPLAILVPILRRRRAARLWLTRPWTNAAHISADVRF